LFESTTAKLVTFACAVLGAVAFAAILFLSLTNGSEFVKFALALFFFVVFLTGAYWWMSFGGGKNM
jgi:heme/copper-type cytochrome/quinol oxidase subunit 4